MTMPKFPCYPDMPVILRGSSWPLRLMSQSYQQISAAGGRVAQLDVKKDAIGSKTFKGEIHIRYKRLKIDQRLMSDVVVDREK